MVWSCPHLDPVFVSNGGGQARLVGRITGEVDALVVHVALASRRDIHNMLHTRSNQYRTVGIERMPAQDKADKMSRRH